MIDQIKKEAAKLFAEKKVDLIIGYKKASHNRGAIPYFLYNQNDVDKLLWDTSCVYNLVTYLLDFKDKKVGIVVKACDLKSIIVLLQENQLKRENLLIIGLECSGVREEKNFGVNEAANKRESFDRKCKDCKPSTPVLYDVLIKGEDRGKVLLKADTDPLEAVRKLEAKSPDEKFNLWKKEFSRCIRCYACRQICPMCYCPTCVADQTEPAWFSKAANLEGNLSWIVTRAMHLSGRCVDCGECERACPAGISLRDISKKIEKDVKELFNYEAGTSVDQKPLLNQFDPCDPGDFIR